MAAPPTNERRDIARSTRSRVVSRNTALATAAAEGDARAASRAGGRPTKRRKTTGAAARVAEEVLRSPAGDAAHVTPTRSPRCAPSYAVSPP